MQDLDATDVTVKILGGHVWIYATGRDGVVSTLRALDVERVTVYFSSAIGDPGFHVQHDLHGIALVRDNTPRASA